MEMEEHLRELPILRNINFIFLLGGVPTQACVRPGNEVTRFTRRMKTTTLYGKAENRQGQVQGEMVLWVAVAVWAVMMVQD